LANINSASGARLQASALSSQLSALSSQLSASKFHSVFINVNE
jgi:hypothetical protein